MADWDYTVYEDNAESSYAVELADAQETGAPAAADRCVEFARATKPFWT